MKAREQEEKKMEGMRHSRFFKHRQKIDDERIYSEDANWNKEEGSK